MGCGASSPAPQEQKPQRDRLKDVGKDDDPDDALHRKGYVVIDFD